MTYGNVIIINPEHNHRHSPALEVFGEFFDDLAEEFSDIDIGHPAWDNQDDSEWEAFTNSVSSGDNGFHWEIINDLSLLKPKLLPLRAMFSIPNKDINEDTKEAARKAAAQNQKPIFVLCLNKKNTQEDIEAIIDEVGLKPYHIIMVGDEIYSHRNHIRKVTGIQTKYELAKLAP